MPEAPSEEWMQVFANLLPAHYLAESLAALIEHDTNYPTRYPLVFAAADAALQCGYAAGIRIDPAEPDWPVIYIELPTGQVSWHMPAHSVVFDGHTTPEKHDRIRAFLAANAKEGPVA
ncbi:hypothetical protein L3Q65_45990 [Amycolatopsis sp. FU40]|uniref:hypothetical protein n=1 Tax=Amycolatopsis sp. FU40 TaxID=2914159 RepID=UPI001F2F46D4|nr:hypothetical protein [Amycolatopsis sp. FU40]UKD55126.1 hypothetical protein L3Q65_45990 [Amycolatopsis sp. FU40]